MAARTVARIMFDFTSPHPQQAPQSDDAVSLRLLESVLRGEAAAMNFDAIDNANLLDQVEMATTNDRSPRTRTDYRRIQEHFVDFLKPYGVTLLTAKKQHVQAFLAHLSGERTKVVARLVETCGFCKARGVTLKKYSASYRKRHLAAIKAAYDYLIDAGLVQGDPTSRIKRPTVNVTRQYTPSTEEVRALLDYHGTPLSRLVVRWAYYAPARRAELVSPRWCDIDEFGRWHLIAKGNKSHSYDLNPELIAALRVYRDYQQRLARRHPAMARALADPETAYIFMTKSGRAVTGGQLVRILKRHAVRAGVALVEAPSTQWDTVDGMTSRLSPHAMRRAWASHSLNDRENPVPLDVIQMVFGQADIRTTRLHYAQTDDGRASDALRRRRL